MLDSLAFKICRVHDVCVLRSNQLLFENDMCVQNPPHPVVLAKVRGYPLWPAKVRTIIEYNCRYYNCLIYKFYVCLHF